MKKTLLKSLMASTSFAIILPGTALADVSAQDVWDMWKNSVEASGQELTIGSQENDGADLILHNVTFTSQSPKAKGSGTIEMMKFHEQGDGTVSVSISGDIPFSITSKDTENASAVDLAFITRQEGLNMIASGTPDNISYEYTADNVTFELNKLFVDGEDTNVVLSIVLNGVSGTSTSKKGNMIERESNMTAASLSYDMSMKNPDGDGQLTAKGQAEDVKINSDSMMPMGISMMSDPAVMFTSGLSAKGGFETGASKTEVKMDAGKDSFSSMSSAQSNSLTFSIEDGTIGYGGGAVGVKYTVSMAQLPFPELNAEMDRARFNFMFPMAQSDDPKDFKFLFSLEGLKLDEQLWSMVDPGSVLPRDPLTLTIDTAGQMQMLTNIFRDPAELTAEERDRPATINSLKINEIKLAAAGAEVNGTGDFTFNNDDLTTFDGLPAPTGSVILNIIGANGLIDKLVQMGIIPDDQAMSARMMLGLFARPSGGEDTLTSEIKVEGDGSIFANGQQLR